MPVPAPAPKPINPSLFICRVELRGNPEPPVYKSLHQQMAGIGFLQTIVAFDGKTYNLPHAMYSKLTTEDLTALYSAAKVIAQAHQPEAIVFMMKTERWQGNVSPA